MKEKYLWSLSVVFLLLILPQTLSAERVVVPAGTPFFFDYTLTQKAGITALESFETERVPGSGRANSFFRDGQDLSRVEVVECRLPGLDGTFWFSPQVKIDSDNKYHLEKRLAWEFFAAGVISFLLFAFGFVLLKKMKAGSVRRCCLMAVLAALLHCGFLSLALWRNGWAFTIINDDMYYMQVAGLIRSGNFSDIVFRYTIGYPILCVIYTFLIPDVVSVQAFLPLIAFVNGFLVSSLFAAGAFLLLRRISGKDWCAFLGVILWQVFLFFHQVYPFLDSSSPSRLAKAWLDFPEATPHGIFGISRNEGHFAMSDHPSALGITLCFLTILYLKRPLIPLSLLFGFLCLIRINNIFFAPVFLFLLILKYREVLKRKWTFPLFCLIGAIGFLAVFSAQLAVNYRQFGNPFVFPYVLHQNRASEGFLFSEFPAGFLYTCLWNNACFAFALPSLLLMKDRFLRVVIVLTVIPLTLFFSGYAEWRIFDMRGMITLYPFLFAAPFLSDWWKGVPKSVLLTAVCSMAAAMLFASAPIPFFKLLPFRLELVPYGKIIALIMLSFEMALLLFALIRAMPYRELFLFLALFALMFHAGTAFCPGLLIAVLCVLTLKDLILFYRAGDACRIPFLTSVPSDKDQNG